MAIVKGPIVMTGSLGDVSFYTRRGSDKVIARTKGGASKSKIKTSPKFEKFREQQVEWKGCTSFASVLRYSFGGLHRLADYNLTPVLNALAKEIQKTDTANFKGSRALYFSKYRYLIDGFNLNRNNPFNTVLKKSVNGTIDRENKKAVIQIPRIIALNDLNNWLRLPYYRIIGSLGVVSDLVFSNKQYSPVNANIHGVSEVKTGEWLSTESTTDAYEMVIEIDENFVPLQSENLSFVLSIGIEFGKLDFAGKPLEVKYAGSAKVVMCS